MFRVAFHHEPDQKIRQLAKLPRTSSPVQGFWQELAGLVQEISESPLELGEPKFDYKHVKMRSYLALRNFIAIQYAVNEEFQFVLVGKISLSGNHPYPAEFEKVLNSKIT